MAGKVLLYLVTHDQMVYFLRVVLACICGGLVGIERQQRTKVAGTKTHILIALAASLMMIISKYGFNDVVVLEGISLDASRVAAGIAGGAVFLGGGIIFNGKRGNVSGLTTAAGAWVTIGIGMSLGAGMYAIGIAITLLMLFIQMFLHKNLWIVKQPTKAQVSFRIEKEKEAYKKVVGELEKYGINFYQFRWERKSKSSFILCCQVVIPSQYGRDEIAEMFTGMEEVETFEVI